jgi:hypothetical protein
MQNHFPETSAQKIASSADAGQFSGILLKTSFVFAFISVVEKQHAANGISTQQSLQLLLIFAKYRNPQVRIDLCVCKRNFHFAPRSVTQLCVLAHPLKKADYIRHDILLIIALMLIGSHWTLTDPWYKTLL